MGLPFNVNGNRRQMPWQVCATQIFLHTHIFYTQTVCPSNVNGNRRQMPWHACAKP